MVWLSAALWPKSRPVQRLWECDECGGAQLIKLCTLALSCFPSRQGTSDHTGGQKQELPSAAAFSARGGRDLWLLATAASSLRTVSLRLSRGRVIYNARCSCGRRQSECITLNLFILNYLTVQRHYKVKEQYRLIIATSFGANYLCPGRKVAFQSQRKQTKDLEKLRNQASRQWSEQNLKATRMMADFWFLSG